MAVQIESARVVLADRVAPVSVRVEAGMITGLDVARDGARAINAAGLLLAPALVDIHGDAFERALAPRPGVAFPTDTALLDVDRQLAAHGIATAYHALTLSWEPGLRSVAHSAAVIEALAALAPRLSVEHRVQLRWETFAGAALPVIEMALAGPLLPAIAFNDHSSMSMRAFEVPLQARAFEHSPEFAVADPADPRMPARLAGMARRAGVPGGEIAARLAQVWAGRDAVPGRIAKVAAIGRKAGAPMLSHDDTQPETRDFYRGHGARITEFPMSVRVAQSARAAGDTLVFGAPNALRGNSHLGSLSAEAMIAQGLCDILASDYSYPAMLAAIAALEARTGAPLHRLWPLVAANPAAAMGLSDRGRIAPGQRADLVLLDWPQGGAPAVRMTMSGGRIAYGSGPIFRF